MQVFVINISVIFAFGLMIAAIVFKGLLQAKTYAVERQLLEKRTASESNSTAPQEPNRTKLSSQRNTPGTSSVR